MRCERRPMMGCYPLDMAQRMGRYWCMEWFLRRLWERNRMVDFWRATQRAALEARP